MPVVPDLQLGTEGVMLRKSLQHSRDLVGEALAIRFRQFAGDRHFGAGRKVVTEHVSLNPPNGRYNSPSLVDDFKAVPTVMDHLLKTSDLPFDSPQAGDLSAVIYGIVTCDGLRWATRHSLPPENMTYPKDTKRSVRVSESSLVRATWKEFL